MERARRVRQGARVAGGAGSTALAEILAARGEGLAATESKLERRYLEMCDATGIPRPNPQVQLWWRDRVVGRVDMAYPEQRVIVELDGRRGHQQLVDQERDRIRDQEAAAAGWLTARVTWNQLHRGRAALVERINAILSNRRESPAQNAR